MEKTMIISDFLFEQMYQSIIWDINIINLMIKESKFLNSYLEGKKSGLTQSLDTICRFFNMQQLNSLQLNQFGCEL